MPADLIATLFADWAWVAAAAIGIMIALVAGVYAVGSILMNEKIKTWAKMELVEVFYSAIIIMLGITSLPLIDSVVQSAIGVTDLGGHSMTTTWLRDPGAGIFTEQLVDICSDDMIEHPDSVYHKVPACHMRIGVYYLRNIFSEATDFAYGVYKSYIWSSMAAEFSINVEVAFEQAGFFTWTPWRGFFTMGNVVKELSFDWSMKIMQITKFQEDMLILISSAIFPGLFVVGAILRTFAFTRRLGGLMLGLAITLYFIFPAFYAFGGLVTLSLKEQARDIWIGSEANVHGTMDPPIANTIYVTGNVSLPSGDMDLKQYDDDLANFESMSDEEFADYVENSDGLTPQIDLSKRTEMTPAEQEAAFERSNAGFSSWFGSVSRKNMWDVFLPSYWGPNGFIDVLARLAFFSLFFALFGILGTIAAVRSLSMTFGGDIEIAGLTRLI